MASITTRAGKGSPLTNNEIDANFNNLNDDKVEGPLLGTVSESSGDPTGAVIERGSNANGEFVKFADGTMICTINTASTGAWTALGSLYTTTTVTWTFPSAFSAFPVVLGHADNVTVQVATRTNSATEAGHRMICAQNSLGVPRTVRLTAIGRWF